MTRKQRNSIFVAVTTSMISTRYCIAFKNTTTNELKKSRWHQEIDDRFFDVTELTEGEKNTLIQLTDNIGQLSDNIIWPPRDEANNNYLVVSGNNPKSSISDKKTKFENNDDYVAEDESINDKIDDYIKKKINDRKEEDWENSDRDVEDCDDFVWEEDDDEVEDWDDSYFEDEGKEEGDDGDLNNKSNDSRDMNEDKLLGYEVDSDERNSENDTGKKYDKNSPIFSKSEPKWYDPKSNVFVRRLRGENLSTKGFRELRENRKSNNKRRMNNSRAAKQRQVRREKAKQMRIQANGRHNVPVAKGAYQNAAYQNAATYGKGGAYGKGGNIKGKKNGGANNNGYGGYGGYGGHNHGNGVHNHGDADHNHGNGGQNQGKKAADIAAKKGKKNNMVAPAPVAPIVTIPVLAPSSPSPPPTPPPTPDPTPDPTPMPTESRNSLRETPEPTPTPTLRPTPDPTPRPTLEGDPNSPGTPSFLPTPDPTPVPTPDPTPDPTPEPTIPVTDQPSDGPDTTPFPTPDGPFTRCFVDRSPGIGCPQPNLREVCDKYNADASFSECFQGCIDAFCCIHDSESTRAKSCSKQENCSFFDPCYIIWYKLHDTIGPAPYLRLEQDEAFYADVKTEEFKQVLSNRPDFKTQLFGHHFQTDDLPLTDDTFNTQDNWT